jgi:putative peptide zinc metalloprotease protein
MDTSAISAADQTPLPVLRPDLRLMPGPRHADGSPTWVLHDPLADTYDHIDWKQKQVLDALPHCTSLDDLQMALARRTTLHMSRGAIRDFCEDLHRRGLTVESIPASQSSNHGPFFSRLGRLVPQLLFARFPLIRPQPMLDATWPIVRHLGGKPAWMFYIMCWTLGLVLLVPRWSQYTADLKHLVNWRGAVGALLIVAAIRLIHEMAHAYAARSRNVRVPTMGIALLVGWPVPYCDVTGAWGLSRRTDRLLISIAGIAAELAIGGIALLCWSLAHDGAFQQAMAMLSSITILSTVLINLNPALRYDGYYVLSDLLAVDNLQSRAFNWTRWWVYHHLLGIHSEQPESSLSAFHRAGMLAYTIYAWLYRFMLYTAIAMMAYHLLAKAMGVIMMIAVAGQLIIAPLMREMSRLVRRRDVIAYRGPAGLALAAMVLLLAWSALPLPRRISLPARTRPAIQQDLFVPHAGIITTLNAKTGQTVRQGDVICELTAPWLRLEEQLTQHQIDQVRMRLNRASSDAAVRATLLQYHEEIARLRAQKQRLEQLTAQHQIRADIDGIIVEWDRALGIGATVPGRAHLGTVVNPHRPALIAWVPEDLLPYISAGQSVRFVPESGQSPRTGRVVSIDPTPVLSESPADTAGIAEQPMIAGHKGISSVYPVSPHTGSYTIRIELERAADETPLRLGQGGHIWLRTPPRSYLYETGRRIWRVLVRESGF